MIDIKKISTDVKLEIIYIWLEQLDENSGYTFNDLYLIDKISKILLEERKQKYEEVFNNWFINYIKFVFCK